MFVTLVVSWCLVMLIQLTLVPLMGSTHCVFLCVWVLRQRWCGVSAQAANTTRAAQL